MGVGGGGGNGESEELAGRPTGGLGVDDEAGDVEEGGREGENGGRENEWRERMGGPSKGGFGVDRIAAAREALLDGSAFSPIRFFIGCISATHVII